MSEFNNEEYQEITEATEENTKSESLFAFLLENPVDEVEKTITIKLERNGKKIDATFRIKPCSAKQWQSYQKQTNGIKRNKVEFDNAKFHELLVINHTVEPNFRKLDNIKKAGCRTPDELLYKLLMVGEVALIADEITSLSGFDATVAEMAEEVKNS